LATKGPPVDVAAAGATASPSGCTGTDVSDLRWSWCDGKT